MRVKTTMMDLPLSLNHVLDRSIRLFPQSEIVSRLPDKSYRRHTFADWHARTFRLAAALRRAGLEPGDRVATLCWNHHVHLECYFGIPAAGGVLHTLNLRLGPEELGWIAADAGDRFLVIDDVLLPVYRQFAKHHKFERVFVFPFSGARFPTDAGVGDAAPALENYEQLLDGVASSEAGTFRAKPHDENAPVAMCYTSGTTGRPKGVVYSHRSVMLHTFAGLSTDMWGLSGLDVIMPATPMFHANCWGIPFGAVFVGSKMVFTGPHLHAEDLLDQMQVDPPNFFLGVPTVMLSMLQLHEGQPGKWKLPAMRCQVGGSSVPPSLIAAFARHGVNIRQGWGMTEMSPLGSLFYEKPELSGKLTEEQWLQRKSLAGVPPPLVDIRIVADGAEQPWDGTSIGEIQVRGPFVTGRYHGLEPDLEKFTSDGWLRTGDVGSIDTNGYVRVTDRTKDLIKSGGEWISSVDLENAIMGHPAVSEAAVIAVPHAKWGERPLACVVLKPGAKLTARALLDHIAPHFAKWQLPDAVEFMEAIPRNSTGKFWKSKLRETFANYPLPA